MMKQRFIGIVHRIKKTAKGEARPTLVCIQIGESQAMYLLETETDELDFLLHRFPIQFREIEPDEDLSGFLPRQLKWKKLAKDYDLTEIAENHRRQVDGVWYQAVKAPVKFEGFEANDTVAMILGGSGDRFAYAISRRSEEIGSRI
ncbi:MAG TPA: hypothetical protein VJG65_00910, partial [Patescibacteria group bacterium]|nr:hypothetical protein [Patescibacteria group bacterium]